jgi:hypothetical protein
MTDTAQPPKQPTTTEDLKLPVLEDDDQFSEFTQEDWTEAEAAGAFEAEMWQDDWDDDEAKTAPEFAFQLRAEMERIQQQQQK